MEEERSRCDEDSQLMWMMMMVMVGNVRQTSPNTISSTDNSNDQKRKAEDKEQE